MTIVKSLYNIINRGANMQAVSAPVFLLYRESLSILPKLIKSSLKQRLTTQPIKRIKSACNELPVLSCDLHNILKILRGLGMPIIG